MSTMNLRPLSGTEPRRRPRRLAIATPYLNRLQRQHFLLLTVVPFCGTIVAGGLAFVRPVTRLDLTLFFVMWLATGVGVSVGYHRLFTHRSFEATKRVRVLLAALGGMAGLGPVISWAAMHRRHHQYADRDGDMHSPNLHGKSWIGKIRGLVHAHLTWMIQHEYPNIVHYTPDLLEDSAIVRTSRRYATWVLLGLAIPTTVGGLVSRSLAGAATGFLWGGLVRMFVVAQSISALNSILHSAGEQHFDLRDNSRNNWLLGVLIWGEGWHNNHHAFPRSASFGLRWYRVDISYWLIRLMEKLGIAWNVVVPTAEQLGSRYSSPGETSPSSPDTYPNSY
jgi:stearoyl-CoA desaturase (delta-9 desaturase)